MSRAEDFVALMGDPSALPPVIGDHGADETLMALLVHLACADGVMQEEELAFLRSVWPNKSGADILSWVAETASRPLDLTAVTIKLGADRRQAQGALRFAARLAWSDQLIDTSEKTLLDDIIVALGLGAYDLEEALDEVVGRPSGRPVQPERVTAAFRGMAWRAISPDESPLFSDLAAVAPPGAKPVVRLLADGVEQAAVYDSGLAAQFIEGPRFLKWADIAQYTRVPVLGATLRVITRDGVTLTVADPRLQEVGSLLDRVYAAEPR